MAVALGSCSRKQQMSRWMLLVALSVGVVVDRHAMIVEASSFRDDLHIGSLISEPIRSAHPEELVRSQARIWVEDLSQDIFSDDDDDSVDSLLRDVTKSTIGVQSVVLESDNSHRHPPRHLERYRLRTPLEQDEPSSSLSPPRPRSSGNANTQFKPTLTSTGTTIAGICGVDPNTRESFCVLAADTRATADRMVADKQCSKIHCLAHNLWCCGAGTSADLDQTTRHCRYALALSAMTEQASLGNCRVQAYQTITTNANMEDRDDLYLERPAEHCASMATACRFLRSLLYESQGSIGANLIIGGIDPATGLAQIRAIHPHGSMDTLPYAALGSGGLAAMAILESRYSSLVGTMDVSSAMDLVRDAILAGIQNDMGSGSQVDLCVMTWASGGVVVTRHLRAHVPEEELPTLDDYHESIKRESPKPTTSTPGVNGFGSLPYSVRSRRLVLPNTQTIEAERLKKWDDFLGISP